MEARSTGFKECYRHPGKPAIRDCLGCGRPICRECESESGNPLQCPPCTKPRQEEPPPESVEQASARRQILSLGDVTVHSDGSVEEPVLPSPPGPHPERVQAVPPLQVKPADKAQDESVVPLPAEIRPRPTIPPGESVPARPLPEEESKPTSEILRQVLYALPFAIAACVFAFGFWLLFAFYKHRWTQISVFTAGMLIPLVLYKCTTIRKKTGRKVWRKPPPPLYLAVVSTAILLTFTPVFEVLAYHIAFRLELRPAFSVFASQYFKPLDWVLVFCGFGLAFVFPFFLKIGERWPWPSRKKKA